MDLFSDLDYSNFVYSTVLYHTYGPALVLKSFHPNVCIIVKAPFLHSWDLFCSRAVMILHSTASTLVLERSPIHVQSATQYIITYAQQILLYICLVSNSFPLFSLESYWRPYSFSVPNCLPTFSSNPIGLPFTNPCIYGLPSFSPILVAYCYIQCTTDKLTPLNIKKSSALEVAPP